MAGGAVGLLVRMAAPFPTGDPGAYALVGMGTLFAGIIRAPMTEVIGARMMPAKSVPIPTRAYAPGSPVGNGAAIRTSSPTAPPAIAPMQNVGANTPPAFPDA